MKYAYPETPPLEQARAELRRVQDEDRDACKEAMDLCIRGLFNFDAATGASRITMAQADLLSHAAARICECRIQMAGLRTVLGAMAGAELDEKVGSND